MRNKCNIRNPDNFKCLFFSNFNCILMYAIFQLIFTKFWNCEEIYNSPFFLIYNNFIYKNLLFSWVWCIFYSRRKWWMSLTEGNRSVTIFVDISECNRRDYGLYQPRVRLERSSDMSSEYMEVIPLLDFRVHYGEYWVASLKTWSSTREPTYWHIKYITTIYTVTCQ